MEQLKGPEEEGDCEDAPQRRTERIALTGEGNEPRCGSGREEEKSRTQRDDVPPRQSDLTLRLPPNGLELSRLASQD